MTNQKQSKVTTHAEIYGGTAPAETPEEKQKQANSTITDSSLDQMANETGRQLAAQEKVRIMVPGDPLNPKDNSVPVCINGYVYQVKRGVRVEVPEAVAQILEDAGYLGGRR